MENDNELLSRFVRENSQDAFTELVNRHLGLVYSAAMRQVRSPQLAEDVSQTVFTQLARNANKLSADSNLAAWLYRATRNASVDAIRVETRRQARELLSVQMSATNDTPADWSQIEPLLDEAVHSLDESDRTAILLRYFQKKSLAEVGRALGASEDAAQKRVSRAIDRLREFLAERKVAITTASLMALLSANALQAVPAGLGTTVASSAILASGTIASIATTTVTSTLAIAMTTTQKIVVAALLAAAIAGGTYEGFRANSLGRELDALRQQEGRNESLKSERDQAKAMAAQLSEENKALKERPSDVLKLRSEVGHLQKENADINSKSALSKLTADPESRKALHDQQRVGMSMIYSSFARQMSLASDQKDKFNDLLADHVMNNVDLVTTALRDKPDLAQMQQNFNAQDTALQQQVQALLGADGLAQFNDYNKNLAATLTADQFKSMMTGTDAERDAKTQQLTQAMESDMSTALANANLPANYQVVPILNFANIASQDQADQSLTLLQNIYQALQTQAASFLSPEEQSKLQEFTGQAVGNNRNALSLNRTLMAPLGQ